MCGEEKKKQGEMSFEVEDNREKGWVRGEIRIGDRVEGREHYKVALIEKVRPWGHHQLSTNCVCC